jgi:hypothetical protein
LAAFYQSDFPLPLVSLVTRPRYDNAELSLTCQRKSQSIKKIELFCLQ